MQRRNLTGDALGNARSRQARRLWQSSDEVRRSVIDRGSPHVRSKRVLRSRQKTLEAKKLASKNVSR
jgi:hypothetical protein